MQASKARYVAVCQQLLVLGVVLAVIAPAADVVSIDVVAPAPVALTTAAGPSADQGVLVPDEPVTPVVEDYSLTSDRSSADRALPGAVTRRTLSGGEQVVSRPAAVRGFGTIGVTWSPREQVGEDELAVRVRTRTGAGWTSWAQMPYHDDHAPDPGSVEARGSRPGTEPVVVGDVEAVQVQAVTMDGAAPADLTLSVIAPGETDTPQLQGPEIDTSESTTQSTPGRALERGVVTARPRIYSRAQWGADERLRNGAPSYFEVHAGFVHHTVNSNSYAAAEVPGILRSIYAYHTRSRGWSDIGYNFLVDRFGRIWEGRYGGVTRPVVGAHTSGYNNYAFAMSAIGNFDITRPSSAMLSAYGRLMAWKLSLHGVAATAARQQVGGRSFPAVNGHRDADSTACPGRYLYAQLPRIRALAATYQQSWSGRQRTTDLVSTAYPDIVLRRASDGAGFVLPTEGMLRLVPPRVVGSQAWAAKDVIVALPDVTGDGRADVLARDRDTGTAVVHPGDGTGGFGAGAQPTSAFAGAELITSVGDLDGDRRRDLVGRDADSGRLLVFAGRGNGTFERRVGAAGWAAYNALVGIGDLNRDRFNDLLARDTAGGLWLVPGRGAAGLGARVSLPGDWARFDALAGFGDYDGDRRPDLFARSARTGHSFVFPGMGARGFRHWQGPLLAAAGVRKLSSPGNVVGGPAPDLVGRRNGALVVVQHGDSHNTSRLRSLGLDLSEAKTLLNVGDWDRDGDGDLVVRLRGGDLVLHTSDGRGSFAAGVRIGRGFHRVALLAAVGDLTGDGFPDLMGQPLGAATRIYPGRGQLGLGYSFQAHSPIRAQRLVGVGLWDSGGAPDVVLRVDNRLQLRPSNGPGGLMGARSLDLDVSSYGWLLGPGQVGAGPHPDLVARDRSTGSLWLLPGYPRGFGRRVFLRDGLAGFDLAG